MQFNHIKIFLGINYHTIPGENVLVVGSLPELGNWDPFKGFPLTYHQGDNWSKALVIERKLITVEYKYVIIKDSTKEVRWEEGDNRVLDLVNLSLTKHEIFNMEAWNHREVNIRMQYPCLKKQVLAICGEGSVLGNWKNPIRMIQVTRKDPLTKIKSSYWEHKFFVRHDVKPIKYRFVLIDDEEDSLLWEREPNRVCDFVNLTTCHKKFETHPNKKDCFKFARKHNRFIKYDCNFVSKFCFDQITEQIVIGPYPQNKQEIQSLAQEGVKAVLNLQTKSDMRHRMLDWDEIKIGYKDNGTRLIHFPITDMSVEDIRCKAYEAAVVLNEIVTKYGKVYVHCTAGVWRAPHVVAAYLNLFQSFTIEEAYSLIKEKRPLVYLSKELLHKALKKYERRIKDSELHILHGSSSHRGEPKEQVKTHTEENGAKRSEQGNQEGFQLGSTLIEVRCPSERNL